MTDSLAQLVSTKWHGCWHACCVPQRTHSSFAAAAAMLVEECNDAVKIPNGIRGQPLLFQVGDKFTDKGFISNDKLILWLSAWQKQRASTDVMVVPKALCAKLNSCVDLSFPPPKAIRCLLDNPLEEP